jgi:hypothetical protein
LILYIYGETLDETFGSTQEFGPGESEEEGEPEGKIH